MPGTGLVPGTLPAPCQEVTSPSGSHTCFVATLPSRSASSSPFVLRCFLDLQVTGLEASPRYSDLNPDLIWQLGGAYLRRRSLTHGGIPSVDNRRRTQVMNLLKGYGSRVQRSVFECRLSAQAFAAVDRELRALIDSQTDSVRCYPPDAAAVQRIVIYGAGQVTAEPTHYLV